MAKLLSVVAALSVSLPITSSARFSRPRACLAQGPAVLKARADSLFSFPAARDDLAQAGSPSLVSLELVSGEALHSSTVGALNNGRTYAGTEVAGIEGGRGFVPGDGAAVVLTLDRGHDLFSIVSLTGSEEGGAGQRYTLEAAAVGGGFISLDKVNAAGPASGKLQVALLGDDQGSIPLARSVDRLRFTFRDPGAAAASVYRELDVFAGPAPGCPAEGDTFCITSFPRSPPNEGPGVYRFTASARDDSGDDIIYKFLFKKSRGQADPQFPQVATGWQLSPEVAFRLNDVHEGTWSLTVFTDDLLSCDDEAFEDGESKAFCNPTQISGDDPACLILRQGEE